MHYPANLQTIAQWEQKLNSLNEQCTVPHHELARIFELKELEPILQRKPTGMAAVNYQSTSGQFSNRYINEGWMWANLLAHLKFSECIELCPGKSIVVDLALAFNGFEGVLTKIDYRTWEQFNPCEINKKFSYRLLDLNVLTHTSSIPKTQLFLLNHVIDDLLMGLWAERHQYDFFGIWGDWDEVDRCWDSAISDGLKPFHETLKQFMRDLAAKLLPQGHIILRDYPSAYETTRRQLARTNFCRGLTLSLVQELQDSGLKIVNNLTDDNTFFILVNSKIN